MPWLTSRSRTSGRASTLMISACRREMTGRGVFAGATTPYQLPASYPGRPDSATVGRSGMKAERALLVTAIARRRPPFTKGTTDNAVLNATARRPALKSVSPGPLPLSGTCVSVTPAFDANNSPPRCGALRAPAEGYVSSPGLARADAMRSVIDLIGEEGGTATIRGLDPTMVIGAKLLIESYGNFV